MRFTNVAALRYALLAAALSATLPACHRVIVPPAEPAERAAAERAGATYAAPVDKRPLPELSTSLTLALALEYAFNANGELEAAYREWRAAIERVPQAGALPDPRIDFSFLFSPANLKSFSSALDAVVLMAEQDLPATAKREARAQLALAEAQAAGERFRAARFQLQRRVIDAYAAIALNEALLLQTSETLALLDDAHEVAVHRFHGMSGAEDAERLSDLRKIEVEIKRVESDRRALPIQRRQLAAELNGALNRPPDSPLGAAEFPVISAPAESDATLFERAVRRNPELAALRQEIEARGAAQTLAELESRPDYRIGMGMEELAPALSMGLTLPINRARIRAGIQEALASRQAAEARLRAAESDAQARVVMALEGIRDAQRILDDYREVILPATRELLDAQTATYGAGGGDILDVLDTERLLIEFRILVLQAQTDRLRYLAALEEAMGEDLFSFAHAAPEGEGGR